MVELRKRPARDPAPAPPAKRSSSKSKAPSKVKQAVNKAKAAVTGKPAESEEPQPAAPVTATEGDAAPLVASETGALPETTATAGETSAAAAPATTAAAPATTAASTSTTKLDKSSVGSTVSPLDGFGGTVSTHDGREVTVAQLLKEVEESVGGKGKGLVIFTYPKASTPGCTTQACLFRDNYKPITEKGYAVCGLSSDSEKSNGNFVAKQGLQYPLLCDTNATLTSAIGMKKPGPGKGTTRGVVVLGTDGKVKVWEQAGPQRTLDVVLDFVKGEEA